MLRHDWPDNEFAILERLTDAGVTVPFPVARTADGVLMQYIGDRTMAAPRLVHAGLDRVRVQDAAAQLVENLHRMAGAGVVHADLSVYNLLWWEARLWIIDVPQAVDVSLNGQALDFLHRDLVNVAGWFPRRRHVRRRSAVQRVGATRSDRGAATAREIRRDRCSAGRRDQVGRLHVPHRLVSGSPYGIDAQFCGAGFPAMRSWIHQTFPCGSRTRPTRSPHASSVISVTGSAPASIARANTASPLTT